MIKPIVMFLFLFIVLFQPSSGRPSLLPIELDGSSVNFGQTDQMQYIDKTELLSIIVNKSRVNETDEGNMTTTTVQRSSSPVRKIERKPLSVFSFGRNTTSEGERQPEYNVIKLN